MNYRELLRKVREMTPTEKEEHRSELRRALKIRLHEIGMHEDKPTIGKLWRMNDQNS